MPALESAVKNRETAGSTLKSVLRDDLFLAAPGLDGEDAANDIRELCGLLEAFNMAKRTAWQTVVKMITIGFVLALVAGAIIKLKIFGGGQ